MTPEQLLTWPALWETLDVPGLAMLTGAGLWRVYALLVRRFVAEAKAAAEDRAALRATLHAIDKRLEVASTEARAVAVAMQAHFESDRADFAELRSAVLEGRRR